MKLAWGARVSPQFRTRVIEICGRLGMAPSWLMACMAFESGHTFRSDIRNVQSGATGLIQFMPSTAEGLGTSVDALARLTPEEQLVWVEKYFQPYSGKINSLADAYMAILWPKAVGMNGDYPLFSGGSAYAQNMGLDVDRDHVVTKSEAASKVQQALVEGLHDENAYDVEAQQPPAPIEDHGVPAEPTKAHMGPLALLQLFAPILGKLIPQIGNVLQPDSPVATNNPSIIQILLDTILKAAEAARVKEAVPTPPVTTLEGAVTLMQLNSEVKRAVQEAVVTQPDIIGILEIGGGIKEARAAGLAMQTAERPFWYNPTFWISIAFFPMMYMVAYQVLFTVGGPAMIGETAAPWYTQVGFDPQTRSGLVNLIVGFVFGGIVGVWFGTSYGSQRKTELSAARGESLG